MVCFGEGPAGIACALEKIRCCIDGLKCCRWREIPAVCKSSLKLVSVLCPPIPFTLYKQK